MARQKNGEKRNGISAATIALVLLEAFALFSVVTFASTAKWEKVALAAATVPLLLWPYLAQMLLRARFADGLLIGLMLFSLGPVLGHSYQLYYSIPLWDSILHTASGVLFACVGFYFPVLANQNTNTHSRPPQYGPPSRLLQYAFAVCFAFFSAAVWEFFEFGSDMLFHTDMQNDTVIHGFTSYMLGGAVGETGSISSITQVVIDGRELGLGGYLDIGLVDTMKDMLVCALGAVLFCLGEAWNRGRRKAIQPRTPAPGQ